jgi:hypothetical protein
MNKVDIITVTQNCVIILETRPELQLVKIQPQLQA